MLKPSVEIDEAARAGFPFSTITASAASPIRRLRRYQTDRGDHAEREHRDGDAGANRTTGGRPHLRYGPPSERWLTSAPQQAAHRKSVGRAKLFGPGGHTAPVCPLAAAADRSPASAHRELTTDAGQCRAIR